MTPDVWHSRAPDVLHLSPQGTGVEYVKAIAGRSTVVTPKGLTESLVPSLFLLYSKSGITESWLVRLRLAIMDLPS